MITLLSVRYASQFDPRLLTAQKVLAIVPQLVLMLIVMALSLRAGPIGYQRVAGAVLTYLLVARVWARLYALLAHLVPGAIVVANGNGNVSAEPDLVYFSIMTLATSSSTSNFRVWAWCGSRPSTRRLQISGTGCGDPTSATPRCTPQRST